MADMRVKMFLDLVSNTKGGAAKAKRELKGVKDAARDLNRQEAGKRITRDILSISSKAPAAARRLREVKTAATGIGADGGAAKLSRDLERAQANARRLATELRGVKKQTLAATLGRQPKAGAVPGGAPGKEGGATTLFPGTRGMLGGYLGIHAARAGVRGTVGQSVSREKAMAEVQKKVDLPTGETFANLERTISKFAIAYGQSFESVAATVAEAGAAGVAFDQLTGFTELATKAAIAWDMPAREAAEKLFEIRAATQSTLPQLEEFADMINALGDSSAAKESSIVEMFQRVGAAAKEAGVPIKTSLAFLTGIRSVGIRDEVGARAFGALTNKLITADRSKKGTKALKELGLDAKTFAKRMRTDATGALLSFFEALEKSPDAIGPLTDFVGNEWFDEVLRMKGAVTEVRKALELLSDPKNYKGSTANALNIQLRTTASHLEQLKSLSAEVGNRLGDWALPGINDAIEKLITGMNALDKRAADKQEAEDLAKKKAAGTPLTPEEREKLARDRQLAAGVNRRGNQISAQQDYAETSARIEGADDTGAALSERAQLLRRQLERQINNIETELKLTPDAVGPAKNRRLQALKRQLSDIPTSPYDKRIASQDPRRPADMGDKFEVDGREALRERMNQLESRLQVLKDLADSSSNRADKAGFDSDAQPVRARRDQALRRLLGYTAPNATAAGRFGLNGAPGGQIPATGSGQSSFGLGGWKKGSGAAWAKHVRSEDDIDLGEGGVTMMERYRSTIEAGGAGAAAAAAGVKDNVMSALLGIDATSAGHAVGQSMAAGITASGGAAVAAATALGARVKAAAESAAGGGDRRTISNGLHDGVD